MSSGSKNKLRITLEGKIKLPISLALLVYSIIVSGLTGTMVAMTMLMSFAGDVLLMKHGNCFYNKAPKDFAFGVLMFMASHAGYAKLMNTTENENILSIMLCIGALYLIALLLGLENKVVISAIYVMVLILSVINTYYYNTMAFIGGLLFLISDFAIGIFDIIRNRSLLRHIAVWGTYVPAQILMMTSFFIK